jgi:Tfp pilus assembly protein PilF
LHAYGQFLVGQERFLDGSNFLQQAASDVDYLGRAMAFEDLAMLQLYQGNTEQAQAAFSRAVMLDATLPISHWHLARLAFVQGDTSLAQNHYQSLLHLIEANVLEHSEQTLQFGVELSQARQDDAMQQSLLNQLKQMQSDQPLR